VVAARTVTGCDRILFGDRKKQSKTELNDKHRFSAYPNGTKERREEDRRELVRQWLTNSVDFGTLSQSK
jgi:hypothetical protein